jgi:superfamily I DNA/RNA helicase
MFLRFSLEMLCISKHIAASQKQLVHEIVQMVVDYLGYENFLAARGDQGDRQFYIVNLIRHAHFYEYGNKRTKELPPRPIDKAMLHSRRQAAVRPIRRAPAAKARTRPTYHGDFTSSVTMASQEYERLKRPLYGFIRQCTRRSSLMQTEEELDEQKVRVMTVHSAKG